MSPARTGIRQTEEYAYQSLHWAFPMVPLVLSPFALITPGWSTIGALLAGVVAAVAGLSSLHSRLRDSDLLPASVWDRFIASRLAVVEAVWVIASLATVILMGFTPGRDLFIAVALPGFVGGALALPLLARGVGGILTGIVAIVLGQMALWSAGFFLPRDDADAVLRMTATYWVAFVAAMIVGFSSMFLNVLRTTRELERARVDGARLAVAEERLRFSRDLHDVFGRTLSAVALKAELAAAQAERGRPEAVDTMREVQSIAVSAQEEVRAVVRGYRETDLAAEIDGARALLEATGITVASTVEGGDALPGPVARAFAWVVREGATNILRHAHATQARIAVTSDPEGVWVAVTNDRPHTGSDAAGSGLDGLRERLAEVGGTLTAERHEDEFTLVAQVDRDALARLAGAEETP